MAYFSRATASPPVLPHLTQAQLDSALNIAKELLQGINAIAVGTNASELTGLLKGVSTALSSQASDLSGHFLPDFDTFCRRGRECLPDYYESGPATATSGAWANSRAAAHMEGLLKEYQGIDNRADMLDKLLEARDYVSDPAWTKLSQDLGFLTRMLEEVTTTVAVLKAADKRPTKRSSRGLWGKTRSSKKDEELEGLATESLLEVQGQFVQHGTKAMRKRWATLQEAAANVGVPAPPSSLTGRDWAATYDAAKDVLSMITVTSDYLKRRRDEQAFVICDTTADGQTV